MLEGSEEKASTLCFNRMIRSTLEEGKGELVCQWVEGAKTAVGNHTGT